ncbi:TSCPD domain-containing protein, partial [Lacrimispora sp.]
MKYKTHGVCSQEINFEVEDNKLVQVQFVGGCSGNTQGVAR